ncbi:MAG: hypothetical protein R3C01_04515 [Planctomycetaceae bacterium]
MTNHRPKLDFSIPDHDAITWGCLGLWIAWTSVMLGLLHVTCYIGLMYWIHGFDYWLEESVSPLSEFGSWIVVDIAYYVIPVVPWAALLAYRMPSNALKTKTFQRMAISALWVTWCCGVAGSFGLAHVYAWMDYPHADYWYEVMPHAESWRVMAKRYLPAVTCWRIIGMQSPILGLLVFSTVILPQRPSNKWTVWATILFIGLTLTRVRTDGFGDPIVNGTAWFCVFIGLTLSILHFAQRQWPTRENHLEATSASDRIS